MDQLPLLRQGQVPRPERCGLGRDGPARAFDLDQLPRGA
jgi:hypothetical protein